MVPRDKEALYYKICKSFKENIIDIPQEFVDYKTCYISDVNNYVIIDDRNSLKLKGKYEWDVKYMMETKNNSNRISRKAAVRYLVDNIPLKKTIDSEQNIYYFCIAAKAVKSKKKGQAVFKYHNINDPLEYNKSKTLQKNIRYIITNKDGIIKKYYPDHEKDKGAFLEAYPDKKVTDEWYQKLMLDVKSENIKDYDINWKYYHKEASKLIKFKELSKFSIVNQLTLF